MREREIDRIQITKGHAHPAEGHQLYHRRPVIDHLLCKGGLLEYHDRGVSRSGLDFGESTQNRVEEVESEKMEDKSRAGEKSGDRSQKV